ncbi:MAG: PorV/PorQ family protein [Chitinivibrionales bacterium]|nr:PorV/PorQ family protein [Chitinivibrionales bacterium]
MRDYKFIAFFFAGLALHSGLFAQSQDFASLGYANTAAAYLYLPNNAQSIALSGSVTAWKNKSSWSQFNPALLDAVNPYSVSFTTAIMDNDRHFYAAAVPIPTGPYFITGISLISFGVNNIEGRDEFGGLTQNFNDNETAVALTAAGKLPYNISCGIAGRYLNQMLETGRANGFGFDAGATYDPFSCLTIGISALHIGSHLAWNTGENDLVRPTGRLGIAGNLADSTLRIEGDFIKADYMPLEMSAGAEYVLLKMFAVRAGASTSVLIADQKSALPDFSAGLGIYFNFLTADFACKIPGNGLAPSYRISLTIDIPAAMKQW